MGEMLEWLWQPVDRVCERTTPLLLGQEVLNDWTHAAFFVGCAVAVWFHFRHTRLQGWNVGLALWIGVIGLASTSFHLYPIGLTYVADSLAIMVFMALYTYWATRVLRGFTHSQSLTFSGGFLLATALCGVPSRVVGPEVLTLTFLPSLMFMAWLATTAATPLARRNFRLATSDFALSMLAHMADLPLCAATHGHGLHWLWHVCNGVMLALLVTALPKIQRTN